MRRICHEEVKFAIFSIHPDKSLGPDGFSPGFYQAYWDIMGVDIAKVCDEAMISGNIPPGINKTHIVLIPKNSSLKFLTLLKWVSG